VLRTVAQSSRRTIDQKIDRSRREEANPHPQGPAGEWAELPFRGLKQQDPQIMRVASPSLLRLSHIFRTSLRNLGCDAATVVDAKIVVNEKLR
jgi:hypothetical protein